MQCYIQSLFIIARHIAVSSSDQASLEHRQSVMTVVSCNWGLAALAQAAFRAEKKTPQKTTKPQNKPHTIEKHVN